MSLFKAREWWATLCGDGGFEEEFAPDALVVGNLDNQVGAGGSSAKIAVGSLHGMLRIFAPRAAGYNVRDLLLEESLDAPILALAAGRFAATVDGVTLAVLHPRSLVVYSLQAVGGAVASYYELRKLYSHAFGSSGRSFTAFNMTYGPFGGVYGRDYIAVQSMDGQLAVYEQDKYAFTRQLPRSLLPGPLAYVSKMDFIVTANSAMEVEAYRYNAIAASSSATAPPGAGGSGLSGGVAGRSVSRGGVAGAIMSAAGESKTEEERRAGRRGSKSGSRKLVTEWTLNVGELVSDIFVSRFSADISASQVDIVVVGQHTLFAVKESGTLRMQKRLGYFPAAVTAYAAGSSGDGDAAGEMENVIIASHTAQLMIYRSTQLIWACRAPQQPVALAVATFAGLPGLVVSLDCRGALQVSYMGTDPPTRAVSTADGREPDYAAMDAEHRKLLAVIKSSRKDRRGEPADRVVLRVQVPSVLEPAATAEAIEEGHDVSQWAALDADSLVQAQLRLFVNYTGGDAAKNVNISVRTSDWVHCLQPTMLLSSLSGGRATPTILPLQLRVRPGLMPSDLSVTIAASYMTESGEPRAASIVAELPLCLAARVVPPVKNNVFKFTLDTNRPPEALHALFEDMLTQPGMTDDVLSRVGASSATVMTFQYFNGCDVTILVSKSAGRYRVQSGDLAALHLVSLELARRLRVHFEENEGDGADEPFALSYAEALPLADFFALIDAHFDARKALADALDELNDRAHQFRVVQKRLLVRYKQRTPSALKHMDSLLRGTYDQVLQLAGRVERSQKELKAAANRLSCGTHLLLQLIRLSYDLDEPNFEVMRRYLSPDVVDTSEQGWEEMVDASMTHLLRTTLAKTAKETATLPQTLVAPPDTSKLKKHIAIVCDRLMRGSRPYRPPAAAGDPAEKAAPSRVADADGGERAAAGEEGE